MAPSDLEDLKQALKELSENFHDLDKRLFVVEGSVNRFDKIMIDISTKVEMLPERIVAQIGHMINDKLKMFQAEVCAKNHPVKPNEPADTPVADRKFNEWIIRSLVGIIGMVVMYFIKGQLPTP